MNYWNEESEYYFTSWVTTTESIPLNSPPLIRKIKSSYSNLRIQKWYWSRRKKFPRKTPKQMHYINLNEAAAELGQILRDTEAQIKDDLAIKKE